MKVAVGVGGRPPGCAFAPRCDQRRDACELAPPPLEEIAPAHRVRCLEWRRTPPLELSLLEDAAVAAAAAPPVTPLAALDPDLVYVNAAARALLGTADRATLQNDGRAQTFAVGGRIAAEGPPLLVMDIAGAQTHFDRVGSLSRIDVRLAPGARQETVMAALDAGPDVRAAAPDEAAA